MKVSQLKPGVKINLGNPLGVASFIERDQRREKSYFQSNIRLYPEDNGVVSLTDYQLRSYNPIKP